MVNQQDFNNVNHYVYIVWDDDRLYIGKRSCKCPIEDDPYMGSYSDKSFFPHSKEVLTVCKSSQQALDVEFELLKFFKAMSTDIFVNKVNYIPGRSGSVASQTTKHVMNARPWVKEQISETVKQRWVEGVYDNRTPNTVKMKEWYETEEGLACRQKTSERTKEMWKQGLFPRFTKEDCSKGYRAAWLDIPSELRKERLLYRRSQINKRWVPENLNKVVNKINKHNKCLDNNLNSKGEVLKGNQRANIIRGLQRLNLTRKWLEVDVKLMDIETRGIISSYTLW